MSTRNRNREGKKQNPHHRKHQNPITASSIGDTTGTAFIQRGDSFSDVKRALTTYLERKGLHKPFQDFSYGRQRGEESQEA